MIRSRAGRFRGAVLRLRRSRFPFLDLCVVMANNAPGRGTYDGMMTRHMTDNATNHRTLHTTLGAAHAGQQRDGRGDCDGQ